MSVPIVSADVLFTDPCFSSSHSGGAEVQAVRSAEGKGSIGSRKKVAEKANH